MSGLASTGTVPTSPKPTNQHNQHPNTSTSTPTGNASQINNLASETKPPGTDGATKVKVSLQFLTTNPRTRFQVSLAQLGDTQARRNELIVWFCTALLRVQRREIRPR